MKRSDRQARRLQSIDRRMRARQLQRWHRERMSESMRLRQLAFLHELAGRVDAGFTPAELIEAEAALATRDPGQQQLDLGAGRHART